MPIVMSENLKKLSVDTTEEFREAVKALAGIRGQDMGPMLEHVLAEGEDADVLIFVGELREVLAKIRQHRTPKKPKGK